MMSASRLTPLHQMLSRAAHSHGINLEQMRGPLRHRALVAARWDFIRSAIRAGRFSTTQIGRAVNRDHTTVMYAAGLLKRKPKR